MPCWVVEVAWHSHGTTYADADTEAAELAHVHLQHEKINLT